MRFLEERRIRKIKEEASLNAQTGQDREIKIETERKTKKETVKELLPSAVLTIFTFLLDAQILRGQYGNTLSTILSIVLIISTSIILTFLTHKLYHPPSDLFVVVRLTDKRNEESKYEITKWLIPKKIIGEYHVIGQQYTLETTDGLAYFCDDLEWNENEIKITFGYQNLDRFAFVTQQGTFERVMKMNKALIHKNNLIKDHMEIMIDLKARQISNERIKRILRTRVKGDIEIGESNAEQLIKEVDEEEQEIRNILTGVE